jgi:hypothetical protein
MHKLITLTITAILLTVLIGQCSAGSSASSAISSTSSSLTKKRRIKNAGTVSRARKGAGKPIPQRDWDFTDDQIKTMYATDKSDAKETFSKEKSTPVTACTWNMQGSGQVEKWAYVEKFMSGACTIMLLQEMGAPPGRARPVWTKQSDGTFQPKQWKVTGVGILDEYRWGNLRLFYHKEDIGANRVNLGIVVPFQ